LRSSNTSLRLSLLLCLAGGFRPALALDPNRAVSQYIHDEWISGQQLQSGAVHALSQTLDGYLWIGGDRGLVRFDGLNFLPFSDPSSGTSPPAPVQDLAADSSGSLWIRYQNMAVSQYRGRFASWQGSVTTMSQGADDSVLLLVPTRGFLHYRVERTETLPITTSIFNFLVISLAQTVDGTVWLGTRDSGLFAYKDGLLSAISKGLPDRKINCLLPVNDHELWVGTDNGVVRWNGKELTPAGVPGTLEHVQALSMLRDRDANIWVGTSSGLYRVGYGGVDGGRQGVPANVNALFEDREGNLWVGTSRGIERYRDRAFLSFSPSAAVRSERSGPVYVDEDDRIWTGPPEGGLLWRKGTQSGRIAAAGLDSDVVYSIAGSKHELWLGRRRGGLTRLALRGQSIAAQTFTRAAGLDQDSVYAVYAGSNGIVWAGTVSGALSWLQNGIIHSEPAIRAVTAIAESPDGTMWFATSDGIHELAGGQWRAYSGSDGLPPGKVSCLFVDAAGVLWIGTPEGLAYLKNNRIEVPREVPPALHEEVEGMAADEYGGFWISTFNRIARIRRAALLQGTVKSEDVREYGVDDGLIGTEGVQRFRSAVADSLGRIWFSTNRGIAVVDPSRLTRASVPAIAHIEEVSVDGKTLPANGSYFLPAGSKKTTVKFVGLSLSVPERVKFRYRLDPFDADWSRPSTGREMTFTNLSPGTYRFRVSASNADGLWNGAEATASFQMEPEIAQTWWFRLGSVVVVIVAIAGIYRLRLSHLTNQLNVRFEERLSERTRIAQELHDTLLQGVLSASMQLHVASDRLPADSPARQPLNRVMELMAQVSREGRNAVRGLRAARDESQDLEQAFLRLPRELAAPEEIKFRVIVDGRQKVIHPILRDDVYRIGREAVVNAFRHSRADAIEVELDYESSELRLLVRDNGCGIDSAVLKSGRHGHFGLTGMRERAERLGGKLTVWSSSTAGTEVVLSVPGHVAFTPDTTTRSGNRPGAWFRRIFSKGKPIQGGEE
jgi:signal transduction histidine kinase/ligand-binding sensor domain-containing protein